MKKTMIMGAVLIGLTGCSTVTIKPDPTVVVNKTPSYEDSRHFFFWGLAGEERVNVSEVCEGQPAQMQSQQTFLDGLFGGLTLGIYAPHSVKVWCQDTVINKEGV
ncbi:Bor family protein [Ferrimonas balearica DSM 9799]|uniref:Bor family protein n=1 Tax=Ferrimonas balearica (strain DSM 9799 / CCM 4581 / KCTC 23876 / PAT) TaxID=550540 RepID=E1SLX3_FERBD|nr:Bor family protein [Ferrimonas balearica]ADN75505.1 Bor family protein [Ferrimonas balearica DSM 9799]MBY5979159.1 Bor family protein [Ferrimonas balearica]